MSDNKDKSGRPHQLQPVPAVKDQMVVHDPSVQAGFDDDSIDLREYWQVLVKRRWIILAVVAIVVAAAGLATLLAIPEYRSTAQIQITPVGGRVLAFDDFDGAQQQGRQFDEYRVSQIEILRSRALVEQVVRNENLAGHPELSGELRQRSLRGGVRSMLATVRGAVRSDSAEGVNERDPVSAAADRLRQRIEVQPIRNSQLLNVSVVSFDPELAARVTNALVAQYTRNNLQRRVDAGADAREFLDEQLVEMRATLERSDEALMDFARQTNIADMEERLGMTRTALRRLGDRQSEVEAELVQIGAWRELIEQGRADTLDPLVDSPIIQELQRRLVDANTEYTRLSATLQDQFPRMQEVLGRIARLESEIESQRAAIIDNIINRYDNLTAQEAALARAIAAREADILLLNERGVQYNILRREFETSRELYDGLLQRMKEIGVAAGVQENNIAVIDPARPASLPFSPNLPRNLALAVVLGLMGGVGLALLLEFLDSSIRRVEDIERLVDRPVLGMVPLVKDRTGKERKRPSVVEEPEKSISFYSKIKPSSGVSEAFRSLRTSLSFSTAEGMPHVIMITSSSMGEGKTTSAINLATVLAQNGSRVLLIDGDLRKARIHREFNHPRSPGLTDRIALFENSAVDSDGGKSSIFSTFIDNLFVMPAGSTTPSPAEMLSSERLNKVIQGCRRAFDHVIIDAAPVLGLADALILSRRVDGVVFVAKAGSTGKEQFRVSMKRLSQVQASVLGVILNGVDLDSPEYAYYSSYYYNYEGDTDEAREEQPKLRQAAT